MIPCTYFHERKPKTKSKKKPCPSLRLLIRGRDATTERFEAMATDKIHLEEHLYKQFVVVLNAKKEKLRQMRDEGRPSLSSLSFLSLRTILRKS